LAGSDGTLGGHCAKVKRIDYDLLPGRDGKVNLRAGRS
jgi:hypothetical protein